MRVFPAIGLLAFLFTSCTDEPFAFVSEMTVAPNHAVKDHPFQGEGKTIGEWWSAFVEPQLEELFTAAKSNNHDMALAKEKLREVAYSYGLNEQEADVHVQGSDKSPKVNPSTNAQINDSFINAFMVGNNLPFSFGNVMNNKFNLHFFSGSFGIDLFNTIEHQMAAAKHEILSHMDLATGVQSMVRNQLSKEYIRVRLNQNLLQTLNTAIATLKTHLTQLQERINAGLNSKQDAMDGEEFFRQLDLFTADTENELQTAINNISRLTGVADLEKLNTILGSTGQIPAAKENLLAGTPLDVVRNRADVKAKFKNAKQASALMNAAVTQQFPTLQINASLESSATTIFHLLHGDNLSHALGAQLSHNFLNTTDQKAKLRVQRSQMQQAHLEYTKTVHHALTQVADAMVNVITARKKDTSIKSTSQEAQSNRDEAAALTQKDGKNLTQLITAEKNKIAADIQSLQSSAAVSSNMLDLLAALGG